MPHKIKMKDPTLNGKIFGEEVQASPQEGLEALLLHASKSLLVASASSSARWADGSGIPSSSAMSCNR